MNRNFRSQSKGSAKEDSKTSGSDATSPSRALLHHHRHTGNVLVDTDKNSRSKRLPRKHIARNSAGTMAGESSTLYLSLLDDEDFKLIDEHLPHIAQQVALLWGTDALEKYIAHLFLDTREGTRTGFPAGISLALFRLQGKHDQKFDHPTGEHAPGRGLVEE
jgi:hypothetical protein